MKQKSNSKTKSRGRVVLQRSVRRLTATAKCNWYLLTNGMWRGECMYRKYNSTGLWYVAAVTGSLRLDNIKVVRLFLDESMPPNKDIMPH